MKLNINWSVRLKNKAFWMLAIPAFFGFVHAVLECFGIDFDFNTLVDNLLNVVTALFAFLAIIGVVVDPTTKGVSDSQAAMTYVMPKDDTELIHDETV